MIYSRRTSPPPSRIEEATRPKYIIEGVPALTPLLLKIGVKQWCEQSEPDFDCTGGPRITWGNCRYRKNDRAYNLRLVKQRRTLQKIAFELYEHYQELRIADIGFIMGYPATMVGVFMKWMPPVVS